MSKKSIDKNDIERITYIILGGVLIYWLQPSFIHNIVLSKGFFMLTISIILMICISQILNLVSGNKNKDISFIERERINYFNRK